MTEFCHLCGDEILPQEERHEDHIVPRSKGGTDDPENLAPSHGDCNRWKYNKTDLPREHFLARRRGEVPRVASKRNLVPITLYLPREMVASLRRQAEEESIAVGTLLRRIILGQETFRP